MSDKQKRRQHRHQKVIKRVGAHKRKTRRRRVFKRHIKTTWLQKRSSKPRPPASRFFRFGTTNPDSSGYRPMYWGDVSDAGVLKRGVHVASQIRYCPPSVVSDEELPRFKRYGQQSFNSFKDLQDGADQENWYRAKLSGCPATHPIGIDIDGKDHAQTSRLVEIVQEALLPFGLVGRVSHSGGPDNSGFHIEFGDFTGWDHLEEPSLSWRQCLLNVLGKHEQLQVYEKKGLHLKAGDRSNIIDLVPSNAKQAGGMKILRVLGGAYKSKNGKPAKKELRTGESETLYPVGPEILEELNFKKSPEPNQSVRDKLSARRTKALRKYAADPMISTGPHLENLADVLREIHRPGNNHEFGLMIAGAFQERSISDITTMVNTMRRAGYDARDFRSGWDSTLYRRRTNQPTMSTSRLTGHIGNYWVSKVSMALANDLRRSYGEIRSRFGYSQFTHQQIDMMKGSGLASQDQIERFSRYLNCTKFQCDTSCTDCGQKAYSQNVRCTIRYMCGACCLIFARKIEDWIKNQWDEDDQFVITSKKGYATRAAALEEAAYWVPRKSHQERDLVREYYIRIPTPELDGTWTLTLVAKLEAYGAGILRGLYTRGFDTYRTIKAPRLIALVGHSLMSVFDVPHQLVRMGQLDTALGFMDELKGAHLITGAPGAGIAWPTKAKLKEIASGHAKQKAEYINVHGEVVGPCNCAEETPMSHTYTFRPTNTKIIEDAPHPVPLKALVAKHQHDQMLGTAPLEPAPFERTAYALRL